MVVRWNVGRPWAVMPSGSLIASPMRFFPRSSARIRPFTGFVWYSTGTPIIVIASGRTGFIDAEVCPDGTWDTLARSRDRAALLRADFLHHRDRRVDDRVSA